MTKSQPPRLATWLLRRFVLDTANEPLVGDLLEEYRSGRSSLWHLRQVLIAILVNSSREIREHKLVALRGTVMAFVLYHFLWASVVLPAYLELFRQSYKVFGHSGGHWPLYVAGVYMALLALAALITGFSIARLHRPHGSAVVLFSALALPLLELPWFLAATVHDRTPLLSDLAAWVGLGTLAAVGILTGGLWRRPALEPWTLNPEP